MVPGIRAVNAMFLDQCFMFDCYKYMDIPASGSEANFCTLSEGFKANRKG